jgi:O-antigen ligase
MLWTIVLCQGYVGFEMNLNYFGKGYNEAYLGFGGMDNNCFGAGLAASLGPAVALAIASKTWYSRAAASISAVLILHTALLTFSRGTMLGMVAVGLVAFVMMPKRPKHMAALFVTLLIAIRLTGPELAHRYSSTFVATEERDSSAESRIDLWRDCLTVIRQHPVFGVGPANWAIIASSRPTASGWRWRPERESPARLHCCSSSAFLPRGCGRSPANV